jgi:hypothetical protein
MTGTSTAASDRAQGDGFGQMLLTARLFFTAPGWGLVLLRTLVWTLCAHILVNLMDRDSPVLTRAMVIFSAGFFLPWLALMTMAIEGTHAGPLAYFELLPQRTRPLHLVLWPMRLLGIGAAILFTTVGHLPALAAVILAACAWWSVSVGHWMAGRGVLRRTLVFLPVSLQASLVALLATSVSLSAAAICAVGTALVTLVIPRRIAFGQLLAGAGASAKARRKPGTAAVPGKADQILDRPRRRWGTSYRLFKLAAFSVPGPRWLMPTILIIVTTMGALVASSGFGPGFVQWTVTAMMAASALTRTTEIAKVDFFLTRPLSARRRFAATVLPWIVMSLIAPLTQALLIKFSVATTPLYPADNSAHRIFRILGASRESFVRTGQQTAVMVSNDLLWRLYGNTLRMAFLSLAILFGFPLFSAPRGSARRLGWTPWFVAAAVLPYYLAVFYLDRLPLPPLWLAALLAGVSATLFFRQVFSRNLT